MNKSYNKTKMKIIAFTLFASLFITVGYSQTGEVSIEQDDKIEDLLNIYKAANKDHEYYKIQVGFGSHAKAQKIKENVEQDFPGLFSKIDFDSPTYRVRLGKFKTKLEAERKFKEVRIKYPDAMLLKPKKST